ncbi:hypothetical protein GCM10007415_21510 [Parapedobacter pyrenivorans]|uniref:Uncharacterized protein n=1 Tax=Parapedobacter pyrenivorans TaxID=1305674 RepID=A0A917MA84_9SPHI|nr:hypothetical protein [Parapedobacter pyrenivorans]GGG87456.1 hypothetical protein GCM10007415_21510 [Parapedobacter pyrenivorans]
MKLNKQQLKQLRAFIRQQGFTAIDLQMEIIDHVACSIEEKMGENPAATFGQALKQTHAEFGVFGFSTLKEAMANSLRRKYFRQMSLELKRWLSFPALLVVGGFALVLYQLFFLIATPWLLAIVWSVYLAVSLGIFLYNRWLQRRYRKLMVMQFAIQFAFLPTFLFLIGVRFSEIPGQIIIRPEHTWIYASLFAGIILLFAFLFAAYFRIISYAIRKCREFERHVHPTGI